LVILKISQIFHKKSIENLSKNAITLVVKGVVGLKIMKNLTTKTPSLLVFSTSIKKMLCVFLVGVMFFNGFIPKSQESKSDFFSAINCVIHTALFEVFSQCNEVVMLVSNRVTDELLKLFKAQAGSTKPQNKEESDNQTPVPVNTSSDSGIITQRTITEQTQFNIIKTTVVYISYVAINKLYRLYNNIKVEPSDSRATMMFMLLMILFGIYTTRIKDVIRINILKNNIVNRDRLA